MDSFCTGCNKNKFPFFKIYIKDSPWSINRNILKIFCKKCVIQTIFSNVLKSDNNFFFVRHHMSININNNKKKSETYNILLWSILNFFQSC